MGWLGWDWELAAATDVNAVKLAVEGRNNLLGMIFGDGKSRWSGERPRVTPERFRTFAAAHNRRYAQKAARGGLRRRGG